MARFFISFRNGDEPYAAALLSNALANRFGRDEVFRSSDSIGIGCKFSEAILGQLRTSDMVIVVIGPRWLTIDDQDGRRLLWRREDWVRREVAEALKLGKIIIPVLVHGATRLKPAALPSSIRGLAEFQTVTMEHRHIDNTIDRFIEEIIRRGGVPPHPGGRSDAPASHPFDGADDLRIWNVPARLPYFVDRVVPLAALRSALLNERGNHAVVVHGPVGSGKTQLAIEYAHRYAADYRLVWWVGGEPPDLIAAHLAPLAHAVDVDLGADVTTGLPRLLTQLGQRGRWLLVLDGVDDPATLMPYLGGVDLGADLLITSRHPHWELVATGQPMPMFDRAESVSLLSLTLAGQDPVALDRLAAALGDIPLAIAQAARFLAGSLLTIGEYIGLLRTRSGELLHRGAAHAYPTSLAAAWSVALQRLRQDSPAAADLVSFLAHLAPVPIPVGLLELCAPALPAVLSGQLRDRFTLSELVRAVAGTGLVRVVDTRTPARTSGDLQIWPHALFQAFVREGEQAALPSPYGSTAVPRHPVPAEVARVALAVVPRGDPREPREWPRYEVLLPHVLALDLAVSPDPRCHRLLLDATHYLVVRAVANLARSLVESALERWRGEYGPASESTLGALGRLAQVAYRFGEYQHALALDEEVLQERVRMRGADDPQTLSAFHNVAMDRLAAGVYPSEVMMVAKRRRQVLGADHPDTQRSLHNAALEQRADREYAAARAMDEKVYQRLRDSLGPDHPDTLCSAHALILDLHGLGDAKSARDLAKETYERRLRVFGANHPDTLQSAHQYVVGLLAADEVALARTLIEDTLERRRGVLGDDHIDSLSSEFLFGVAVGRTDPAAGEALRRAATARLNGLART